MFFIENPMVLINFLLSYHLIAALQATYSQYVAAQAPKVVVVHSKKEEKAVKAVVSGKGSTEKRRSTKAVV